MEIPRFWAESHKEQVMHGRRRRVRRFGWSNESMDAAQEMADARVNEALKRAASGEDIDRSEQKVAYNGAHGMPIREEIVARDGESVVTRNVYGALCLNTPNALFVDVDLPTGTPWKWTAAVSFFFILAGFVAFETAPILFLLVAISAPFVAILSYRLYIWLSGGHRKRALARFKRFVRRNGNWHLRVYETPAGFRLLAMHATFDPWSEVVAKCFQELGADPVYAQMCRNQRCFRARVSPKPWRVGIDDQMRPRKGVWPIDPAKMPLREAWVREYERRSGGHAACRFIAKLGSDHVDPSAEAVRRWHDDLSRAESTLPMA